MPATIKAQRIEACKRKFNSALDDKAVLFQRRWSALHEMLGIKTLSRVNQRWCKKAIVVMREEYPDAESQRMIGLLDDRVNRAIDRLAKRDAERAAAKAANAGKRGRKQQPTTPAPVAPVDIDVWEA
jgi:hypothetical protein